LFEALKKLSDGKLAADATSHSMSCSFESLTHIFYKDSILGSFCTFLMPVDAATIIFN
jgi:hypothetical protein